VLPRPRTSTPAHGNVGSAHFVRAGGVPRSLEGRSPRRADSAATSQKPMDQRDHPELRLNIDYFLVREAVGHWVGVAARPWASRARSVVMSSRVRCTAMILVPESGHHLEIGQTHVGEGAAVGSLAFGAGANG
jgi:hypothetical protein